MIHICETLTIQPARLNNYVRQFAGTLVPIMAKYDIQLLGLWQAWRGNQLWAFWEVKELSVLDTLDKAMAEDRALVNYTQQAAKNHLNSISRIVFPAKYCPDLATVKKEGRKGALYSLAIQPVDPFKMEEWLALFEKYAIPLQTKYGLRTVGYWVRGAGEPYQAEVYNCMHLGAMKDWAASDAYGKAMHSDPEVQKWWALSLQYRGHHRISHLVPVYLPY